MKTLPKGLPTLAEWIRQEGRDTAAITENGWLSVRHGFGRGFDSFAENRSPDIMDPEGQVELTFAKARAWLERNRDKRFFLFLHTFQVHTPYTPPPRYAQLFAREAGAAEEIPSHERWQTDYEREIRYVDDELRRLFETIDALGLGRDTVFVLTSDHGEAFLEHGFLEHGARLDEEVVRVPLLLWGQGVPRGRRVAVPVAHLDLMPTVLDWMALSAPPWIEGASLVPLLEGGDAAARFAQRPLFSESRGTVALGPERELRPFEPPATLVRVGERKLARYRDGKGGWRYEYYDLSHDPGERQNLWPEQSAQARDLLELLEGYEERGRALRARIDDTGDAQGQAVSLDPSQEEKLRALGYLH
jgi:arylsulfatase A-like enzyme